MVNSYKGRSLQKGQKVKVYFNLHTHLFSVMDMKTGRVVAHGDDIQLTDCSYKVSEILRLKVLREKKKNVHAFVIGTYAGHGELNTEGMDQAYYNPYKVNTFMLGEQELHSSATAYMSSKKIYIN